jgi:hypothetical protein
MKNHPAFSPDITSAIPGFLAPYGLSIKTDEQSSPDSIRGFHLPAMYQTIHFTGFGLIRIR